MSMGDYYTETLYTLYLNYLHDLDSTLFIPNMVNVKNWYLMNQKETKRMMIVGHIAVNKDDDKNIKLIVWDSSNNIDHSKEKYVEEKVYIDEELFIGNTHQLITKTDKKRDSHKWSMFISTLSTKLIKPKSIKCVTYNLHESFKKPKIIVKKPPYLLSRTGWGLFDILVEIEFKEKYKRKDIKITHSLSFKNPVTMTDVNNAIHRSDNYDAFVG
eukprot:45559_1